MGPTRSEAATRREVSALVDALGEFLLFVQRERQLRRAKSRRKASPLGVDEAAHRDRKRSVLAWLHALQESEWTSLCTVVDVGFVKTVLAMGMVTRTAETERARRRRGCAVSAAAYGATEFQIIPHDETARRALVPTEPREFLRRPVARTCDGDALPGFQSQAFIDSCASLEQSMCVLNTMRSCDTLTLAVDGSSRAEWLARMDVIACGRFLSGRPADVVAQPPMWAQTSWFASRGYAALAELVVNQIEMNIWYHWSQAQKSPTHRIPVQGIATKQFLADEWRVSTANQQYEAITTVASQVMPYLRQLAAPSNRVAATTAQLSTLTAILEAWQRSRGAHLWRATKSSVARSIFTIQFADILVSPQAAAVQLLVAELMQDECAKILSDNLAAPAVSTTGSEAGESKNTHAQRRRAARKKATKQRKHDQESRQLHERLLKAVCGEIPRAVRAWEDRSVGYVRDVLAEVVDAVVAAATLENYTIEEEIANSLTDRPRRRKKRGKKKNKQKADDALDNFDGKGALSHTVKETVLPNGSGQPREQLLYSAEEKDKGGNQDQSLMVRPEAPRPLLGFLAAADDASYPPPRVSTPFGTHPFYSQASPFSLQLSAHREAASPSQLRKAEGEDTEAGDTQSPEISSRTISVEPNFDWYLPSLFSSQSSVHTTSTASSLDWDFQRWSLKNENSSTITAGPQMPSSSSSTKLRPILKPTMEASSPVSGCSSSPVSPTLAEDTASTDSSFHLNSFPNIIDISSNVSSKSDVLEGDAASNPDDGSDCDDTARSDFLYREGGFFDRQRGPKRRRRPFPFEYDDDDDEADDSSNEGANGGTRSWKGRLSGTASEVGKVSERSTASTNNSHSCACKGSRGAVDDRSGSRENALLIERISKLESLLEDQFMKFNKESSAVSVELNGLQQQVAILSKRVKSLENELEEVRRASESVCQDGSVISPAPVVPAESPPLVTQPQQQPFPNAVVPTGQGYPHPIMRPGGASNYSILGPFVSVPMSVLPPRSKLHWDMCEYVSLLQADSNARVSAQMAAIRFCTSAVQSLWPRAQVRPYGSFVTRLALPTSDVDLVICLPKVRRDAPADAAGVLEGRNAIKESWQQNLARKLRQEPWVVSDSVKTIPHAAIPIISLVTNLPFNVRLDISFEGPGHNGLATNDVVLSLIHEFPPLAPIMLVLKSFVIERGFAVAYSGGLSSYALLLMVARYLQEHTDRYDNNASASVATSSCADFGMVLMGLLDFYGNRFEPRTTGISVATRSFFNRDSIVPSHQHGYAAVNAVHTVDDTQEHWQQIHHSSHLHSSNLLSSPGSRRHNNRTSLNDWPMQRPHVVPDSSVAAHDPHKFDPVFIEDPLRPSNNVGRNCFRITQIRRAFAAGYETLMAASMSVSVFSENRCQVIGGVPLHPDNILRSILGPGAPASSNHHANAKTDGGVGNMQAAYQPPKVRGGPRVPQNASRFPQVAMPLYNQQQPPPGPYNGGVPYYSGAASGTTAPPPYMLHRMQQQQHQQHQHQQYPQQHYVVARPQARPAESGTPYRRHSESVTEQMTTRSEAASSADKYYVKRNKQTDRGLACSPRLIPPAMHRSSSIELDKKSSNGNGGEDVSGNGGRGLTRKIPSRSMSFADVVMSGGGAATVEHQRKAPSSPLALARTSRRNESALDETINERLETKDDFELK